MLDPSIVSALVNPVRKPGELDEREEQLLQWIGEGRPVKAIATSLQLTPEAANDLVEELFLKLAKEASSGRESALRRLRLLQKAIIDARNLPASISVVEVALGGHDTLYGGGGPSILQGDSGNNLLIGGAGRDTMTGNGGVDTFVFASGDSSAASGNHASPVGSITNSTSSVVLSVARRTSSSMPSLVCATENGRPSRSPSS